MLADLEFIGADSLIYIRIKNNTQVEYANGKIKKAYRFFTDRQEDARTTSNLEKISPTYLGKGEYLIVASNVPVKKHGRRANNLFRYGLDYLRKLISPFNNQLILVLQGGTSPFPTKPINHHAKNRHLIFCRVL